jgi:hypothetical protein
MPANASDEEVALNICPTAQLTPDLAGIDTLETP